MEKVKISNHDHKSPQNELNQLKKVPSTDQMEQSLQRAGGENTTEDENSDKESLKEEKENQVKYISSYISLIHEKRTFVAETAIWAKKIGGKFGLKMA